MNKFTRDPALQMKRVEVFLSKKLLLYLLMVPNRVLKELQIRGLSDSCDVVRKLREDEVSLQVVVAGKLGNCKVWWQKRLYFTALRLWTAPEFDTIPHSAIQESQTVSETQETN